jgi:hypothetical protein
VSVAGLLFGAGSALAYLHWPDPRMASLGFLLCLCWLIADGLDGMIARAAGTSSGVGRFLDGVCDHTVFLFLYLALAFSIGTPGAWVLGAGAGAAHAVQSTLYEGERVRFHRRLSGDPGGEAAAASPYLLARLYDKVASSLDRRAAPFDRLLERTADPGSLIAAWRDAATPPLRFMIPLTNNMRVIAIYLACLAGDPRLFWWLELGPLSLVAITGLIWLRRVEAGLVQKAERP